MSEGSNELLWLPDKKLPYNIDWYKESSKYKIGDGEKDKEEEDMEEEEVEEEEEDVVVVRPTKKKTLKRLRSISEEAKTKSMRDFKMMAQFRKRAPKKKNRW